jgi:sugar fermentation stimulation protein A
VPETAGYGGRGSYVLLIRLAAGQAIKAGSRPETYFPAGYYAYVGSAMGGFKPRLDRHHRKAKTRHWHIDYLLEKAAISGTALVETAVRAECAIAGALSHHFDTVPGFGASDCRCPSHLFFAADEAKLRDGVRSVLDSLPFDKRVRWLSPRVKETPRAGKKVGTNNTP